ncbi:MAG: acetyltransferase [Betaproteobacteria bacterium]|nr:MAG: acetyltransferase [Betaproteobacteria bacterium]
MKFYDVYNGDADGLCALLQLRLVTPRDAILVSGVKRDIRLLQRVDARQGDEIVVADISLDANRSALTRALQNGAQVTWFDHHYPGSIPQHPALTPYIDTDPRICSSLIVNRHLGGRFPEWAIVAAFGDNLEQSARQLAGQVSLQDAEIVVLRELGVCLNYNAYGETIDDLLYSPVDLFRQLQPFSDPRDFIRASDVFGSLKQRMQDDLEHARALQVREIAPGSAYVVLPNASWSRRVVGVYANRLAQDNPCTAHAILVSKPNGYLVSIRAPTAHPTGASKVARAFESGGGREGAAGIDLLPDSELDRLLDAMRSAFSETV